MATKTEILQCLTLLSAGFPEWQKSLSDEKVEETLGVYVQLLADMNGEALKTATLEAIKTLKWFPKIAELRELTLAVVRARRARGLTRPALEEPPPTPEERERVRELLAGLEKNMDANTRGTLH